MARHAHCGPAMLRDWFPTLLAAVLLVVFT
jgi:hypothetical protein